MTNYWQKKEYMNKNFLNYQNKKLRVNDKKKKLVNKCKYLIS